MSTLNEVVLDFADAYSVIMALRERAVSGFIPGSALLVGQDYRALFDTRPGLSRGVLPLAAMLEEEFPLEGPVYSLERLKWTVEYSSLWGCRMLILTSDFHFGSYSQSAQGVGVWEYEDRYELLAPIFQISQV